MFHPIELAQAWATRSNRARLWRLDPDDLCSRWTSAGGELVLANLPGADLQLELLVVVMTYGRPEPCRRLLERLEQALSSSGIRDRSALLVIRDRCEEDYSAARERSSTVAPTTLWLDARRRMGKVEFWRSYQMAMLLAQRWQPSRALFLHDDVEIEVDMLSRADAIWRATADDPRRRVLYLFSSNKDEPEGRWIHFPRLDLPEKSCRLTNWFDLQAFMVDRECLELLDYRMVPIHPNRWKRKPTTSSGVGRQLTLRLRGRGGIYQAWPPLVCHGAEPSLANQEARQENDLDNRAEYALAHRTPPTSVGSTG